MSAGTPPFLDAAQVLPRIYDPVSDAIQVQGSPSGSAIPIPITSAGGAPLDVVVLNSLIPESYDSISMSYWASGNGAGQIETVQYYVGGLSGTLVATLTLNYNSSAQISSVVRS
jgi:hypothetical protein